MNKLVPVCDSIGAYALCGGDAEAELDPFDENANDRSPYCFRFTWLEPKYTSGNLRNRTCAAVLQKAKLICEQPLITTGKFY